jgi:hypothetical protein
VLNYRTRLRAWTKDPEKREQLAPASTLAFLLTPIISRRLSVRLPTARVKGLLVLPLARVFRSRFSPVVKRCILH